MSTYTLTIRNADGTETTESYADYSAQSEAVIRAKELPEAREIETRRIKNGVDQGMILWKRETAAHLGGAWYGEDLDQ